MLCSKSSQCWLTGKTFFHDVRFHTAKKAKEVIKTRNREVLPHPPYFPDINLSVGLLLVFLSWIIICGNNSSDTQTMSNRLQHNFWTQKNDFFFSKRTFISLCLIRNMQLEPLVFVLKNKISV